MRWAAALAGLACVLSAPMASAADPAVPAGQDPGGEAIALITSGIDYTAPGIASRLARDGEGEMIAWDFSDNDNRPYSSNAAPHEALAARLLAESGAYRIVAIRISTDDPLWLARGAAFAEASPAQIAVIILQEPARAGDERLHLTAMRFKSIHFVAVALASTQTAQTVLLKKSKALPNVDLVTAQTCRGPDEASGSGPMKVARLLCGLIAPLP